MRQTREKKSDDQERHHIAIELLRDLISLNNEIDGSLWVSAMFNLIVFSVKNTGWTYDEFKKEMNYFVKQSKGMFDE